MAKCVNYTKNKNIDDVIACRFLLHSKDYRLIEDKKKTFVRNEYIFSQPSSIVCCSVQLNANEYFPLAFQKIQTKTSDDWPENASEK